MDPFRFGGEGVPSIAAGGDDGFVVVEDAELLQVFAEVQPDPFDGVQLRTIGRKWDDGDVLGKIKRVGTSFQQAALLQLCRHQVLPD